MMNAMFNTLSDKKICLWGFAFKANTGDTRESPAIYIAKRLIEENARVVISDPRALENARAELRGRDTHAAYVEDPVEAARGCHALCLLTEWDLYRSQDFEKIYDSMEKPAFLFDGRNILDHRKCFDIGFNVYPIGKPPMTHF